MRTKFEAKLPEEAEIERQIAIIVSKGLSRKQSMWEVMRKIWREFPKRQLLFERGELLFTSLLLAVVASLLLYTIEAPRDTTDSWTAMLFLISPFLFLALTGFSTIRKQLEGTLELEMTMKYSVYQILAIRMLFYSITASIAHVCCIVIAAQFISMDVFKMISAALTGLFLFAAGLLYVLRGKRPLLHTIIYSISWFAGNFVLFSQAKLVYIQVVLQLPNALYIMMICAAISLFLFGLQQFFKKQQGGTLECLLSKT
ncbi:hypothetical protein [Lysinibacillus odysseyi]|uniref:Uncharacterized protein n=1 Tax=Lysinibacillus odysseyi 34hs-1 = NBRC 100172 TaxID=1220589 RepID=A0A0A3INT0_9BACI|nr:hypothetical protein [Lysinibacillus odysseyi]KGR84483.1 hypothetical protein CD32_12945 [Lysinibacillus odysseyi 34hs-1 = NBRC 100172]